MRVLVSPNSVLRIKQSLPYVSRGGAKLKGGLDYFSIDPREWVCVDIGASTGGFTDCLLQAGASRVYAVDVAYGILDWKIRSDPRVTVLERCNARYLEKKHIPEAIDFCVFDTSFISLTKVLPPVIPLFNRKQIRILCLVKPQFELTNIKPPFLLEISLNRSISRVMKLTVFGARMRWPPSSPPRRSISRNRR